MTDLKFGDLVEVDGTQRLYVKSVDEENKRITLLLLSPADEIPLRDGAEFTTEQKQRVVSALNSGEMTIGLGWVKKVEKPDLKTKIKEIKTLLATMEINSSSRDLFYQVCEKLDDISKN